jgi:hypothetical protein
MPAGGIKDCYSRIALSRHTNQLREKAMQRKSFTTGGIAFAALILPASAIATDLQTTSTGYSTVTTYTVTVPDETGQTRPVPVTSARFQKDANGNVVVKAKYAQATTINHTMIAAGTPVTQSNSSTSQVTKTVTPCKLAVDGPWLCVEAIGPQNSNFLPDVSVLPVVANAQSVKVTLYQYDVYVADDWPIPFQLASAVVANSQDVATSNRLKMLDPTQGALNLRKGVLKCLLPKHRCNSS